jgi:hypothetical protein
LALAPEDKMPVDAMNIQGHSSNAGIRDTGRYSVWLDNGIYRDPDMADRMP